MTHRTKLELAINQPVTVELLYDEPIIGESQYGSYSLYAVSVNGVEYSFFAPDEIHTELIKLKKGDTATITKIATQKGSRVATTYNVDLPNKVKPKAEMVSIGEAIDEVVSNVLPEECVELPEVPPHDRYYEVLKQSYADALEINKELNGATSDIARLCITLFIARSKTI